MVNSEEIKSLLADVLPAVDLDADFLFAEMDSLGIATTLLVLSRKYGISLVAEDITPKNFRNTESLAALVRSKLRLEERIRHFASSAPDRPAVICARKGVCADSGNRDGKGLGAGAEDGSGTSADEGPGRGEWETLSYSQLWNAILEKSGELSAAGLKPRRPYVFRATQDADFIVTYCAVHLLGAVAVPLGAGVTEENFLAVKMETESASFSGREGFPVPAATGSGLSSCESGPASFSGAEPQRGETFPDGISDVLFTTGTTGKSKGVMLSETYYAACTDSFFDAMPFGEDLLFIVSGPLNHIASLLKIYPTLSCGDTLCILDGLKDMNSFFNVFNLPFKRFATFLVPAAIRMLMEFSYDKLRSVASKIAFIETGAAPITGSDMERLARALPDSRLYNTYGGTEIGCAASYDFNDWKWMEGCVGKPTKNCAIEIADDGTVVVCGLNVMSGYLNDEEGTREVLRDGKIHLSDLGHFDVDGLLHLTGRLGDVINVGGYKVNPLEVENAAASFPGVKDSICIAAEHPVAGPVLKLLVQFDPAAAAGHTVAGNSAAGHPESFSAPDSGAASSAPAELDSRALARHLKSRLESYKVPVIYETADSIRYTYNGKKDRKFYM